MPGFGEVGFSRSFRRRTFILLHDLQRNTIPLFLCESPFHLYSSESVKFLTPTLDLVVVNYGSQYVRSWCGHGRVLLYR